ncbi:MAG: metallophosphoesterase [Gemmatimonadota bacterium]|nr:MAG: metallophosphoesterase [Gemmatimonadota bacterium]
MKYNEKDIFRRLQEVFDDEAAREQVLDLATGRYVVFSDQHKGQRDGADDFWLCERAYLAALGYYLEAGYTLLALGDVEELWECRPKKVIKAYRYVLEVEGEFYRGDRYARVSGNHDDEWESAASVEKYLGDFFPGITVRQGARYKVTDGGEALGVLFLAHGHQGTTFSDRNKAIAKFFVRNVWRPIQRLFNIRSTTPAKDFVLREEHDRIMYRWAASQSKVVMISGHTHRPVFMSATHHAQLERQLVQARKRLAASPQSREAIESLAALRAELEWVKAQDLGGSGRTEAADGSEKPCYFNTGCCSFSDGDVTGLEIAEGEIRLVRWPDDEGRPVAEVLARASLKDVFAKV